MIRFASMFVTTLVIGYLSTEPIKAFIFCGAISFVLVFGVAIYAGLRNGRYPIFFLWEFNKANKIMLSNNEKLVLFQGALPIALAGASLLLIGLIKPW